MRRTIIAAVMGVVAQGASAQTALTAAQARDQLFDGGGSVLVVQDAATFLSETDRATLRAMPRVAELKYYGALAAAPASGLTSDATTGAFNFHSVAEARAAALRGCEARRAGGPACQIVADVVPRGYRPGRAASLNQDATGAVQGRSLARSGGHLAASASTGAWGLGADDRAAVSACRQGGGAADCTVVVRD